MSVAENSDPGRAKSSLLSVDVPTPAEIAEIEAEGRRKRGLSAVQTMVVGIILAAIGCIVTLYTIVFGGGIYLVFWGPVVVGGVLFLLGLAGWTAELSTRRPPYLTERSAFGAPTEHGVDT